ncbi:Olfactory receptor 10AG1 [Sciurus carolinensis]|uniref:Olfactory receptor 10AG1 n=1 Tax=Sciurus carolinensis TaxID=30640 RepID=A0AA41MEV4_SCICA|nr:Olfactory receptor 10AG1 [Sciurus carolinensis]
MCLFLVLGTAECFLLAVTSYDCYVAICNPLHYPLVMSPKKCHQLVAGACLGGMPVQLACGDTSVHEMSVYVVVIFVAAVPFILILVSYSKIIGTILRLPTAQGRTKAFSTCSSHLLVVVLFFGSGSITYFRPTSSHSAGTDKLLSLFYTIVTPMFNPVIYSLRNQDVIAALIRILLNT